MSSQSSANVGSASIGLFLDDSRLASEFGRARSFFQVQANALQGLVGGLRIGIGGPLGALGLGGLGIAGFISAAVEAEESEKRLAAVINATGNAAGFTAAELLKMAAELQSLTTHSDDEVARAMAKLATFPSITGDAFRRATEAAIDLADVGFGSVEESAIQLGKALEDPEAGLQALRRVGISFSDNQRAAIKSFVETGDQARALDSILRVVESQVGGVGRAMAGGFGGAIKQTKNDLGDLAESIGRSLFPVLRPLADTVRQVALMFQQAEPYALKFGQALGGDVAAALRDIPGLLQSMGEFLGRNYEQFAAWARQVRDIGGDVLTGLADGWKTLVGAISGREVEDAWQAFRDGFSEVLNLTEKWTASWTTSWQVAKTSFEIGLHDIWNSHKAFFAAVLEGAKVSGEQILEMFKFAMNPANWIDPEADIGKHMRATTQDLGEAFVRTLVVEKNRLNAEDEILQALIAQRNVLQEQQVITQNIRGRGRAMQAEQKAQDAANVGKNAAGAAHVKQMLPVLGGLHTAQNVGAIFGPLVGEGLGRVMQDAALGGAMQKKAEIELGPLGALMGGLNPAAMNQLAEMPGRLGGVDKKADKAREKSFQSQRVGLGDLGKQIQSALLSTAAKDDTPKKSLEEQEKIRQGIEELNRKIPWEKGPAGFGQ